EENTAATEQMAAGSNEVTSSIKQIEQLARSNATGASQIAASAEEMSASAEEMASSASTLAEVARGLHQQVAQFKL
ncbi:MAG: methyl-accepting chemotaxis protein, partial [Bacillota bacterium]